MGMVDFNGKTEDDILKEMAKLAGGDERFPPFDAMKAFIQVRTVDKLHRQIAALGETLITQSLSLRESLDNVKDSLDGFRKSNDKSSRAMKGWTIVLAGATIVLAIATIVLAFK
jgi:hypothetical protein